MNLCTPQYRGLLVPLTNRPPQLEYTVTVIRVSLQINIYFLEVFNCPYDKHWDWKKKFALRAMNKIGYGSKKSQDKV